jgi:methyl-accepting chemotaxis protein
MKIYRKLQIESLIILVLLSGSLIISIYSIREIQSGITVFERTRNGVAAAGKLERDVLRLFTVTLDILLSESGEIDHDRLLELRLTSSRINQDRQALGEILLLPEQTAALINKMDTLYTVIEKRLIEPIYNRKSVDPALLRELLYSEYNLIAREFTTLSKDYTLLSDSEGRRIRIQTQSSLSLLILFFGIACFSSLALSWLNQRWIIRPIQHTVRLLDEIASGEADLNLRLPVSGNDEISALCGNVNRVVWSLEQSTSSLKSVSSESRNISESLSVNTHQTNNEIRIIESNIKEMEATISDLQQDMRQSTNRVSRIFNATTEVRRAAQEQNQVIRDSADTTVQTMETVKKLSDDAKERLQASRELTERTKEGALLMEMLNNGIQEVHDTTDIILEAINLITGVSDQTKILSMNAAIEAAHVGEAGKGFAVIAEEIRRLSDATSESTTDIVATLRNMAEQLQRLRVDSLQSMDIIHTVQTETGSFATSFQELSKSLETTAVWGERIGSGLEELSATSGQFSSSAEEMAQQADDIHESINNLNDQFGPLLHKMQRISAGGTAIAQSIVRIETLTSSNREHVAKIDESLKMLSGGRSLS